jgi:hypothetical protein
VPRYSGDSSPRSKRPQVEIMSRCPAPLASASTRDGPRGVVPIRHVVRRRDRLQLLRLRRLIFSMAGTGHEGLNCSPLSPGGTENTLGERSSPPASPGRRRRP